MFLEYYVMHYNPAGFNGLFQVRNMLDDVLEKNLEIVRTPCLNLADPMEIDGVIKLFKKAPPGIRIEDIGM